ncbi:hypothetical protein AB4Z00_09265 [Novosphingobium sp. YAF33]
MEKFLPLLFVLGVVLFSYEVFRGVTAGTTRMRYGSDVSRVRQPVRFWLALGMNVFFAVLCGVFLVKSIIEHWG